MTVCAAFLQAGDLLCEVDVVGLNEDHKSDKLTCGEAMSVKIRCAMSGCED